MADAVLPLDEMLVFARVVEHQSFAGAARRWA